ncbi:MAG: alpha-L-fucosidase [Gemmiger sp.]|nr:alpha-L-fucosidase [Gemmiger sp.]
MDAKINWASLEKATPAWFSGAKFGLFFHWGPYSVPAFQNEWYSRNMYNTSLAQSRHHQETYGNLHDFGYKDFYPGMTGARFDPEEWADLAARAGARYAGPVTEHSDNFSMWDSKVNPINCVNYGPHRDVTGECAAAFRARGLKVLSTFHHQWLWGWFMSTDGEADVYLPENEKYYGPALPLETNRYLPYRMPDEAFCRTWRKKVEEVVEKYHPDALYFDSRTCIIREADRFATAQHYYNHCQNGIITYKQEDFPRSIGVFDLECGRFSAPKPYTWQSDDRLEDNITWCMVQQPKYKSGARIIHQLCDIVAKNGNLLLNVGPYADGSFHPDAVRSLEEVGRWLAQNGEAIYDTHPYRIAGEGPSIVEDANYDVEKLEKQLHTGDAADVHSGLLSDKDFRFTVKGDVLYCIAMGLPRSGQWAVQTLRRGAEPRPVASVQLIGQDAPLTFTQTDTALCIDPPAHPCSQPAYVLKLRFGA